MKVEQNQKSFYIPGYLLELTIKFAFGKNGPDYHQILK
jgi:hypothetical protein